MAPFVLSPVIYRLVQGAGAAVALVVGLAVDLRVGPAKLVPVPLVPSPRTL